MKLHKDVTHWRTLKAFDTLEDRFNKVHSNTYNYNKVVFRANAVKVTIVCKVHGEFEQTPNNHLCGDTCPKCSKVLRAQATIKSTKVFIDEAKQVHCDKYYYTDVEYVHSKEKVAITCKKHGVFKQEPCKHLQGDGCPTCGYESTGHKKRLSYSEFVTKATKIHCGKYDYSNTVYTKSNSAVTIVCPEHGEFTQLPTNHLKGCGCPSCATYGFDPSKPAILYYLSINNGEAYKIGITNRTVRERFGSDMEYLTILKTWHYDSGSECYAKEQSILKEFRQYRYQGNPLLMAGNTELFVHDILDLEHQNISAVQSTTPTTHKGLT